jgi:hypothetical protein
MLGPLTLLHKDLIYSKLSLLGLPFADLAFGNLYLWRRERNSTLVNLEGVLGIEQLSRDQKHQLIPLDPIPANLDAYKKILDRHPHLQLYPLPQEWSDLFPNERYDKVTDRSWEDYIYQTSKIASYGGRALDGHRNHVKHFLTSAI